MTLLYAFACGAAVDPGGDSARDTEPADTDSGGSSATASFDADHVLVVPNYGAVTLLDNTGAEVGRYDFNDLAGTTLCQGRCDSEGGSADGDGGLLLTWAAQGDRAGGVVHLVVDGDTLAYDWSVADMVFPHDAARDPAGNGIIVADAFASRLYWMQEATGDVRYTLDDSNGEWEQCLPNGLQVFSADERNYALMSSRMSGAGGGSGGGGGPGAASGFIALWDITDVTTMTQVWRYPADGGLGDPHGARLKQRDGAWYLLYAHSSGGGDEGSIGFASLTSLTSAPQYLADALPPAPLPAFKWVKGVELTADGTLFLTDAGGMEGNVEGTLLRAPFPADLHATGATGAQTTGGDQQVWTELTGATTFGSADLTHPFEGWLWPRPF